MHCQATSQDQTSQGVSDADLLLAQGQAMSLERIYIYIYLVYILLLVAYNGFSWPRQCSNQAHISGLSCFSGFSYLQNRLKQSELKSSSNLLTSIPSHVVWVSLPNQVSLALKRGPCHAMRNLYDTRWNKSFQAKKFESNCHWPRNNLLYHIYHLSVLQGFILSFSTHFFFFITRPCQSCR